MVVQALLIAIGIILIVASLNDVFQSVIVPRAVGRGYRPTFYTSRALWRIWPALAHRVHPNNEDAREDLLAVFAPLNLVVGLVVWSLMLLAGYGCIFYALRGQMNPAPHSFIDAFYFAGTSFFTIGYGDFVGRTGWTRLLSIAAGASGFGVISTTTAYLFAIFGAFQVREQFVVTTGARAGSPPSGIGLLTIAAHAGTYSDLPGLMREAQNWCAMILETHLAYPILAYFRSSHDYESWVGTLGTLLDAAVLMMTTVECNPGQARILYNLGRHATHDLAHYFRLMDGIDGHDPLISIEQYDDARTRLADAGLRLVERDEAWKGFCQLRSTYAGHLNALAEFFDIPRLQWVGKNALVTSAHIRSQFDEKTLERIDKA